MLRVPGSGPWDPGEPDLTHLGSWCWLLGHFSPAWTLSAVLPLSIFYVVRCGQKLQGLLRPKFSSPTVTRAASCCILLIRAVTALERGEVDSIPDGKSPQGQSGTQRGRDYCHLLWEQPHCTILARTTFHFLCPELKQQLLSVSVLIQMSRQKLTKMKIT